jgi:hypothetical protein
MHKTIEIESQDMFQQNGVEFKRLIKNSQIITFELPCIQRSIWKWMCPCLLVLIVAHKLICWSCKAWGFYFISPP